MSLAFHVVSFSLLDVFATWSSNLLPVSPWNLSAASNDALYSYWSFGDRFLLNAVESLLFRENDTFHDAKWMHTRHPDIPIVTALLASNDIRICRDFLLSLSMLLYFTHRLLPDLQFV
jgi:hypothetical protein